MNTIEVKEMQIEDGYSADYLIIDDVPLPIHFELAGRAVKDKTCESVFGMYPAWGNDLYEPADKRFIWKLILQEEPAVLPVFVCQDDLDLDCSVLVALARKDSQFVYWDKIGYISYKKWDREEEAKSGILHLESYTDEDWLKYGDNIALESYESREWQTWISENWEEESYRRRLNYYQPYYEKNAIWVNRVKWMFPRGMYEGCVEFFREKLTGI